MRASITIIVIIILLLTSFFGNVNVIGDKDYINIKEPAAQRSINTVSAVSNSNVDSGANELTLSSGRLGTNVSQNYFLSNGNTGHSGGWLDSFVDESGIEFGNSDTINTSNEEIKIDMTLPKPFSVDNYTQGLWHFNEGTGSTTNDATINNNDGTITGSSWVNGRFNKALKYNGGTDRVVVSDDSSLDFSSSDSFTLEAWFKTSNSPVSILIKYVEFVSPAYYQLSVPSDGRALFTFRCSNNVHCKLKTDFQVTDNKWHYLAGVRNTAEDKLKLYFDGKLVNSTTDTTTGSISNSASLKFGKYTGGSALGFNGIIDESRISSKARSATEIADHWGRVRYYANLTSQKIQIQKNMKWDSLIINKTIQNNNFINVSILNATNNQIIPGSQVYSNEGEFDISYINAKKYPKIKLNATFKSNGLANPTLNYWGVSWNSSNEWCDTFFGGLKVDSTNKLEITDGKVIMENAGVLRSEVFNIPDACYFDALSINKTQPMGSLLKISVLDGQSNTEISGFSNYEGYQLDISGINPIAHSSIKLKATFSASGVQKGELYNWSISWTKNVKPTILDVRMNGSVNRTFNTLISINASDQNEAEADLVLSAKYRSPMDSIWRSENIGAPIYMNNHWEITYSPPVNAQLGKYAFIFICEDSFQYQYVSSEYYIDVSNNPPKILNITTPSNAVNRTKTMEIIIDTFDIESTNEELSLSMKYRSPVDDVWKTNFLSNPMFEIDHWSVKFTPNKNALLGFYILNITCNDTIDEHYRSIQIEIINNKPLKPTVAIMPTLPSTNDDLSIMVSAGKDIETTASQIEFWYRWYKDEVYLQFFDNMTEVPNLQTTRGEIWKCAVYPHDGDDLGDPSFDEVTIVNSPPTVKEPFRTFVMFEDTKSVLQNKLKNVFTDADHDNLIFSATGQKNINVQIYQDNGTIVFNPLENWFGTESITLYATDTVSESGNETIEITVIPTNDLPRMFKLGSQMITDPTGTLEFLVKQDEWLNISIGVEDIDGDVSRGMITYLLNITERSNLFINTNEHELSYRPTNDDVGNHYFTISVTDNNQTPPIYISQNIKIMVLNVNDPPLAGITRPAQGKIFLDSHSITLDCEALDIDLEIPNNNEKLTYKWTSNITGFSLLGTEKRLVLANDTMLKKGYYEITLTVTDSGGLSASDSVNIEVKRSHSDRDTDRSIFSDNFMIAFFIILLLIIIVIAVALFVFSKRRRHVEEAPEAYSGELLQPVDSYRVPSRATAPYLASQPTAAVGAVSSGPQQDLLAPKATPTPAQTTQPAQLPPAQPTPTVQPSTSTSPPSPHPVQPELKAEEQKLGIETGLTPQQKLKLLEERLIRGEIDQDIYLNLKAKYDLEVKPTAPAPQLPPAGPTVEVPAEQVQPEVSAEPETTTKPMHAEVSPPSEQPVEPELPAELPSDAYTPQEPIPQTQPQEQIQAQAQPQVQPQPQHQQPQSQPQPTPQVPPQPVPQPVPQPRIQPQKPTMDVDSELAKLDDLWAKGQISLEEYQRRKNDLMR